MTALVRNRYARTGTLVPHRQLAARLRLLPTGGHVIEIEGMGSMHVHRGQLAELRELLDEAERRINWDDGSPTDRTNPVVVHLGVEAF
jgi:hypothetical protein